MRKIILLASVAAIPLLSMSILPAPAQQLEEKSGSSMSQPKASDGTREKSSVQGRTEQRHPNSGGESAAKISGSQDKTEGRTSSGSRDEHQTVGQDKSADDKSASDGKSGASRLKAEGDKATDAAKPANQGKAKDQRKDQAKSKDETKGKDAADQAKSKDRDQATARGKDGNQTGSKAGTNQSKGNQTTGTTDTQKQAPTTTGQAPRSNEPAAHNEQNGRNKVPNAREGQNGREPQNNRDTQTGRSEQGGSQSRVDARGSVTLTDEQRTKIRETVFSGRDVPRADRVNFEVEVGRPVPREVRIREVPTTLVEIYPEWRGHEYFVVNDEIVIVDRSRRIVSRVPVGSSSSSSSVETRRSSSTSIEVTYSPEEIRRVQEVLIDKGFYKGRADGVMSVEFKDALTSFQRREGIEVTGRIDERTATSLGVSLRTEGQAGGREDGNRSGQQGARDNDQKSGQNNPANNDKPATSGQAGNPPAQNNPSSSGQGGNAKAQGSVNDPNKKSDNAPSGETTRQPPQQRPSTSGQGGTSPSTNQEVPSQGGPSFKPANPTTPSQPSGQGREGASEQRKQP